MNGIHALLLILIFCVGGCTGTLTPSAPQKSISQMYKEAFDRHFAGADKWMNAAFEESKCYTSFAKTDPDRIKPCLDSLPPPESYIPKDRKKDETVFEYMDRKTDEWEERECFYKGVMQARSIDERYRIENQCMQRSRSRGFGKSYKNRTNST